MGRPKRTLTDEEIKQVETLAPYLTLEQVANHLGIAENTLLARIDDQDGVYEAYKRGRARTIADIASNLVQKAREGDNACMFFYLKTQAGWRETNVQEITGKDGGPIEVSHAKQKLAEKLSGQ